MLPTRRLQLRTEDFRRSQKSPQPLSHMSIPETTSAEAFERASITDPPPSPMTKSAFTERKFSVARLIVSASGLGSMPLKKDTFRPALASALGETRSRYPSFCTVPPPVTRSPCLPGRATALTIWPLMWRSPTTFWSGGFFYLERVPIIVFDFFCHERYCRHDPRNP